MVTDIILDANALRKSFDQADTLGHDTLIVDVQCSFTLDPSKEFGTVPDSNPSSIALSLLSDSEILDERLVTISSRRHQFLLPISATLARSEIAIRANIIEVAGCEAVPNFQIAFATCLRRDLVKSIEEKMVWVFGSPRSGSTWLARDIVCQLPSRSYPFDTMRTRPIDEMGLGAVLGAFVFEPEHFYNIDAVVDHCDPGPDLETATGQRAMRGTPLFQRILYKNYNNPESMLGDRTRDAVRKIIREAAFTHILLHWGVLDYDRVVFKAPNEGHAADLLMEALPRARMIFLMRDGRDIVKSRFSPFASRELAETEECGLRRVAIAYYSHLWNWHSDIVQRAYDSHDPDRRLLLTYEELRIESEEAFERLVQFVDAPMDATALKTLIADVRLENFPEAERGSHLPRQSGKIGAYQDIFIPDEIQLMTTIMAENLSRYGYTPHSSALPTLNKRFSQAEERLPSGISLFVANGLYNDLWCSDRALLVCSLPYAISSVSMTCHIPAAFFSVHQSWTITLTSGRYSQTKTITDENPMTLSLPIFAKKNEPVTLALSSDRFIFPNKDLGQADERRLSFSIMEIGATEP